MVYIYLKRKKKGSHARYMTCVKARVLKLPNLFEDFKKKIVGICIEF
jgi:hypothetical protein